MKLSVPMFVQPSIPHSAVRGASSADVLANEGAEAPSALYDSLREAWRAQPFLSYEERRQALLALRHSIARYQRELIDAAHEDFGCRSEFTTKLGDVFTIQSELDYLLARLKRWMKPSRRQVALEFQWGSAQVQYQALGVVAVIAPWNYPFRLALGPLAAALAAGNRVLLKPSEFAPRCGRLMQHVLTETFQPELVRVILGDAETAASMCRLPFDHVFFTGSTAVGRAVMRAASEHLTPVTLELGGKCPAIVANGYPLGHAAKRIMAGKLFNAGQMCMAPDHVWIHESRLEAFIAEAVSASRTLYPSLAENADYTSIINEAHYGRVLALINDAREAGARAVAVNPAEEPLAPESRKIAPTLLWNVDETMDVAQQEIFGPVLPIHTYTSLDDLLLNLREKPSPLALYYFDEDERRAQHVIQNTRSGGVCINDVVLHSLQNDLPFGGVGASGMGKYHGFEGYQTFSHARAVFRQSRVNGSSLLLPPYTRLARRVLDRLSR